MFTVFFSNCSSTLNSSCMCACVNLHTIIVCMSVLRMCTNAIVAALDY